MEPRQIVKVYSSVLSLVVRILDLLVIMLAATVAYWLPTWPAPLNLQNYQMATLIGVLLVSTVFPGFGIYRSWRGHSHWLQLRTVAVAWLTVVIVLIFLAFLTKTSALFSRQWLVLWGLFGLMLLFALRLGIGWILQRLRAQGWNHKQVIIIGAGACGRAVARQLAQSERLGFDILTFLDDNTALHGTTIENTVVKGGINQLTHLIEQQTIDEVWVTLPLGAEARLKQILYELRHSTVAIRFVPDIFNLQLINHSITEIAGLPVLNLSESPMHGINGVVKFLEDKIVASVILLLTLPLTLLISIGVKLSSPGPVFYRQERVSWNGKAFEMLKFRSMPMNSEHESGPVWTDGQDCRPTPFGAFLRRNSLDELPQFINVLKGDMSVVGPRPERPIFVGQFKEQVPDYMKKHLVKAGITGWAQINGWRGSTDIKRRIEFDLHYIEHWSLWLDLKIIFLTLFKGFIHKNAY